MEVDENSFVDELSVFGITVKGNDVTERFRELQNKYNLDDDSLLEKYVAYRSNKKLGNVVELHHVESFEKENLAKRTSLASKEICENKDVMNESGNLLSADMMEDMEADEAFKDGDLLDNYSTASPMTSRKRPSLAPGPQAVSRQRLSTGSAKTNVEIDTSMNESISTPSNRRFSSRTNAGQIVCSYGDTDGANWSRSDNNYVLEWLIQHGENSNESLPHDQLYMYEKLVERAEIMEAVMEDRIKLLMEQNDTTEQLCPVGMPSQEGCLVGGRIACDSSQGRLNIHSIILEGTRDGSGGRCCALNLTDLATKGAEGFSLFPGLVILCEGVNPSGKQLIVRRIFDSVPLVPQPDVEEDSQPLHMAVACGPFVTSDNNQLDPLLDLLRSVKVHRPHLLVIFGPFVDLQHPQMARFKDQTFEDLFRARLNTVVEWCAHLKIILVVVPSSREMHHHVVYPQPPYNVPLTTTKMQQLYKHVHFVPDPCVLRVGPYTIGMTSTDILMALSAEEVSANRTGPAFDRMARLCGHLLQQRSFYPLYPPTEDVYLDSGLWRRHANLDCRPHLLLLPSQLRHFVKDVSNVLCVNPGRLTRGEAGGTFCRILLRPGAASTSLAEVVRI